GTIRSPAQAGRCGLTVEDRLRIARRRPASGIDRKAAVVGAGRSRGVTARASDAPARRKALVPEERAAELDDRRADLFGLHRRDRAEEALRRRAQGVGFLRACARRKQQRRHRELRCAPACHRARCRASASSKSRSCSATCARYPSGSTNGFGSPAFRSASPACFSSRPEKTPCELRKTSTGISAAFRYVARRSAMMFG